MIVQQRDADVENMDFLAVRFVESARQMIVQILINSKTYQKVVMKMIHPCSHNITSTFTTNESPYTFIKTTFK